MGSFPTTGSSAGHISKIVGTSENSKKVWVGGIIPTKLRRAIVKCVGKVRIGNFLRVCVLEFTVGGFSFGDLTYVQYKFYVPRWSSYIVSSLRRIYVTAS